jgi:hypothetical protein
MRRVLTAVCPSVQPAHPTRGREDRRPDAAPATERAMA